MSREAKSGGSDLCWWVLGLCACAVIASVIHVGFHRSDRGFFMLTLCFMVCLIGGWHDAASRRIPNRLTYPAMMLGLGANLIAHPVLEALGADVALLWAGTVGPREGLLGFGLCAAIGVLSFLSRGLGGGDVKLLASAGAMLGFTAIVPVLFNTLIVAAVIGVLNLALKGAVVAKTQVLAHNLLASVVTKQGLKDFYPFAKTEAPFVVSLTIGLILAQFIELHRVLLDWLGGV